MDDLDIRLMTVIDHLLTMLEENAFDADAIEHLRTLLQLADLIGQLLKLRSSDTISGRVQVILEGEVGKYAE